MTAAERAAAPTSERVAPGVWRVRTMMPGHSFGTLNSYLVEGEGRCALIDTPWAREDVLRDLEEGIARTGHRLDGVDLILLTHYHEDHSGAAGLLRERYGARIAMHPADAEVLRWRAGQGETFEARLREWFSVAGVDEEGCAYGMAQFRKLQSVSSTVEVDCALADGQRIDLGGRALEVLRTPGHTPGHVAFFDRRDRVAFTGDHVFAHRRANATASPVAAHRPIRAYWQSMRRLLALRPLLVLPGHEEPIEDLAARAGELEAVRDAKIAEAVRLARGMTAWEMAARVRRRTAWASLDGNARLAAAGELFAYVLEAEEAGIIRRDDGKPARWFAREPVRAGQDVG